MNYLIDTDLDCQYQLDNLGFAECQPKIAFIDSRVDLNQVPLLNLDLETEIFFIDSETDGIEQVTEVLLNRSNVQSLQLIGFQNRNDANLQLGLSQLNIYTFDAYLSDLYQWQNALSPTSEILLHGCLVVGESNLYSLLQQLAAITGANIGVLVTVPDYLYN